MPYDWGTSTKPASPTADQIYVDNNRQIWQWNATATAWEKRNHMYLKLVDSTRLNLYGRARGAIDVFDHRGVGPLPNEWNDIDQYAFCEVKTPVADASFAMRRAAMTRAQLNSWIDTTLPGPDPFDRNVLLNVYEVVDPTMRVARLQAYNNLFGSLRGHKAYRSKTNRTYFSAGYASKFATYFSRPNFVRDLFNTFGIAVGVENPRALWFTCGFRNLYNMPGSNVGDNLVKVTTIGSGGRQIWDTSAGAYADAPTDYYVYEQCRLIFNDLGTATVNVDDGNLTGLGSVVPYQRSGVLIYLVHQDGAINKKALIAKPYGVSHVRVMCSGTYDLICENIYRSDSTTIRRRKISYTTTAGGVNGWRFRICDGLKLYRIEADLSEPNIDTPSLPQFMQYYLRDPVSGARSETLPLKVVSARRRCSSPVAFLEKRIP